MTSTRIDHSARSPHPGLTDPRLRTLLRFDATLTAGNGLLYLTFAGWIGTWSGAPDALVRGLGGLLLVVGAAVAVLSTRQPVPRTGLLVLIAVNLTWVVGSMGYAGLGALTALGRSWTILQALLVAGFATGQGWFARRG